RRGSNQVEERSISASIQARQGRRLYEATQPSHHSGLDSPESKRESRGVDSRYRNEPAVDFQHYRRTQDGVPDPARRQDLWRERPAAGQFPNQSRSRSRDWNTSRPRLPEWSRGGFRPHHTGSDRSGPKRDIG